MNESATIEEEVTRLVADVDWTDECEVLLHVRKRTMRLTPDQARQIAAALTRSADAAERAADGAVRPVEPFAVDMLGRWDGCRIVQQVAAIAGEVGATVVVEWLSPDCRAGKHSLHQDEAWDDDADVEVPCQCPCHTAANGTAA